LRISQQAFDEMVAHARDAQPDECCGLLIGSASRIEHVHRARNLHANPSTRFLIDPKDHFAAIHAARTIGRAVMGVYHSHPSTPARPSATDLADASYAEYVYAIVSVRTEPAELRLFRLEAGRFVEETLTIS
jgi:proteasome lid subunit RPN8/RPN11